MTRPRRLRPACTALAARGLGLAVRLVGCAALLAACDREAPRAEIAPPPASETAMPAPVPKDSTPVAPGELPPAPTTVDAAVARSINAFAVDLHRALAGRPGNLFVSPASIAIAFAMTNAGARGTTASELATVFHLAGDPAAVQAGFSGALARWSAAKHGRELAVANRLFGEQTVAFAPAFAEVLRTRFAAPIDRVDFKQAAEPARARINTWVAERTRDKIVDLLPAGSVDGGTRLVLVNAVYFKARWAEAFWKSDTRDAPFFAAAGERTVEMMRRTDRLRLGVAADAGLRVLELPYAGDEYAMVIVLPDARDGLAAVEQRLTAAALQRWIDGATEQRVAVSLPRFTIEPGEALRLSSALRKLGLDAAFDPAKADFTGMAPAAERLTISEAYHTAFVAVDEQGTEAAAATAEEAGLGGLGPSDTPVVFTADHPFLFLIRDVESGAILFMGRLAEVHA